MPIVCDFFPDDFQVQTVGVTSDTSCARLFFIFLTRSMCVRLYGWSYFWDAWVKV